MDNDEALVLNLQAAIHMGSEVRSFVRHPVYRELQKWIDNKVVLAHKEWIGCQDKNKRDELWFKVQPYQEMQDYLKKFIIAADTAEANLKTLDVQDPE